MSEILVKMKVNVWNDARPEIRWVTVTRQTKHSVIFQTIRRVTGKSVETEEHQFKRARLERVEDDSRTGRTPGVAVIHWLQDGREPIQGGVEYKKAMYAVLERINEDMRGAAVRINELEDHIA